LECPPSVEWQKENNTGTNPRKKVKDFHSAVFRRSRIVIPIQWKLLASKPMMDKSTGPKMAQKLTGPKMTQRSIGPKDAKMQTLDPIVGVAGESLPCRRYEIG